MIALHPSTDEGLDWLIACPRWRAGFSKLVDLWVETEKAAPYRLALLLDKVIFHDLGDPVTARDLIVVFSEDLTPLPGSIKRMDRDFAKLWNYRELATYMQSVTKYLEYELKSSLVQLSRPKYVHLS